MHLIIGESYTQYITIEKTSVVSSEEPFMTFGSNMTRSKKERKLSRKFILITLNKLIHNAFYEV